MASAAANSITTCCNGQGARLRLGEAWESMERVDGRWLVNGAISAALVIGAGGHFCPVVRFLGANLGKGERAISAQEIEFEMTDDAGTALWRRARPAGAVSSATT